jgi:thiamine biosynthesis lipoprotein
MAAELRFRAMGSDAHVIVVGGAPPLVERARRRIDDLERRWSRFLPDSEISDLNRRAGRPVAVSEETVTLVERAIEAWRLTGGSFDPTVLGDVIRAGYDRPFDDLGPDPTNGHSRLILGCTDIDVAGREIRLPAGTGFDPGGIGKGLAADMVVAETMASGAAGVCVNLGGDLRVTGLDPTDAAWTVAVEHPLAATPLACIGLRDGAVATSTTLRRRWQVDGQLRHHLIDPANGLSCDTDLTLASVVAGAAWTAEVLAKAVLLRGSSRAFDVIDGIGAEALVVDDAGCVSASAGLSAYLGGTRLADRIPVSAAVAGLMNGARR